MSEFDETQELGELEEPDEPKPIDSSLRSRRQHRSEELSKVTTEVFPLPGWEDLLEVELRVQGIRAATLASKHNERVRDEGTRSLYIMCDLLLRATVAFWQVTSNGSKPVEGSWVELAKNLEDCPPSPTPRQAMIFLLKEHRIPWLYANWETWMRTAKVEIDEEIARDFTPTG
jgi:hypothetical protein